MGIVDVAWDLSLFGWVLDSKVNDSEPSTVKYFFLSLRKEVQELVFFSIGSGWGQGFGFVFGQIDFGFLNGFLFSKELVAS